VVLKKSRGKYRKGSAAVLFFVVLTILAIFAGIFGLLFLARFVVTHKTQTTAAESAVLEASRQLSRIVIEDPYYGYVSLCDYPPTGKGTVAPDGEPLPVIGINTALASARTNQLIAGRLGDEQMARLAALEADEARRAARTLEQRLSQALTVRGSERDVNGEVVRPYQNAYEIFQGNVNTLSRGLEPKIQKFSLSLGWLDATCSSGQAVPEPLSMAGVHKGDNISGCYTAYKNVAVGQQEYYFAAISAVPSLVDAAQFHVGDGKRMCSAVKLSADVVEYSLSTEAPGKGVAQYRVHTEACALPPKNDNPQPQPCLVLYFPHGMPICAASIRDLLQCPQATRGHAQMTVARGGDYGKDLSSQLVPGSLPGLDAAPSTGQVLSTVFYNWISAAHGKVRIDSLDEAISVSLSKSVGVSLARPYVIMELDSAGQVAVRACATVPFNYQCLQDGQMLFEIPSALNDGQSPWAITCFDHVAQRGASGGKHIGQPLPANCINWCELQSFGLDRDKAFRAGRGGRYLGLEAAGPSLSGIDGSVAQAGGLFKSGKPINARKTYYSGGLAAYIEVAKAVVEIPTP
jgi:hypothetical protein